MTGSHYAQWQPRRAPARYVACVWTRESIGADGYGQLVVPDGCVDLIWDGRQLEVVGPDQGPRTVAVSGGTDLVGVRFQPGAAGLLLGAVPTYEVCDQQVPYDAYGADRAGRLADRLAEAGPRGTKAAAHVLDGFAASLLRGYEPDALVERAVAVLGRPGPPVRLPRLADSLGLSERQLRRRVTDAVGYGPKSLQLVLRFQHVLAWAWSGEGRTGEPEFDLAQAAVRAGYADQPHLSREVRRLAGMSPTELLRPQQ